jgi:hypothetical protein
VLPRFRSQVKEYHPTPNNCGRNEGQPALGPVGSGEALCRLHDFQKNSTSWLTSRPSAMPSDHRAEPGQRDACTSPSQPSQLELDSLKSRMAAIARAATSIAISC